MPGDSAAAFYILIPSSKEAFPARQSLTRTISKAGRTPDSRHLLLLGTNNLMLRHTLPATADVQFPRGNNRLRRSIISSAAQQWYFYDYGANWLASSAERGERHHDYQFSVGRSRSRKRRRIKIHLQSGNQSSVCVVVVDPNISNCTE